MRINDNGFGQRLAIFLVVINDKYGNTLLIEEIDRLYWICTTIQGDNNVKVPVGQYPFDNIHTEAVAFCLSLWEKRLKLIIQRTAATLQQRDARNSVHIVVANDPYGLSRP